MDIASLVGLIGAVGAILAAMIAGGGVAPFIDTQSIFIVFGGTFFAVMYGEHCIFRKLWCNGKSIFATH